MKKAIIIFEILLFILAGMFIGEYIIAWKNGQNRLDYLITEKQNKLYIKNNECLRKSQPESIKLKDFKMDIFTCNEDILLEIIPNNSNIIIKNWMKFK